jgi:D-sedoheptulose 7-phosphate isomerase
MITITSTSTSTSTSTERNDTRPTDFCLLTTEYSSFLRRLRMSAPPPPALTALVTRYPALASCLPVLAQTATALITTFRRGGKVLLAGNGGSAADCLHIAGELLKGFTSLRPLPAAERAALEERFGVEGAHLGRCLQQGLPAIALPGAIALTTAMANDVDPDLAFAQGVMAFGRPEDLLWCLSTSGTARNVLAAARVARWRGLTTLALTGKDGGPLAPLCDLVILAPGQTTAEIQEHHLPIYHALCESVEVALFGP